MRHSLQKIIFNQRKMRTAILVILFLVIITSGCSFDNGYQSVSTNTPVSTPTVRLCPPLSIETPAYLNRSSNLIVVLLDLDKDYKDYTSQALQIINSVIPEAIDPGDRLVLFRTGMRTFEDSIVLSERTEAYFPPSIPSTPTLIYIATPMPNLVGTTMPGIYGIATENVIHAQQTAAVATATESDFINDCAMDYWSMQFQSQATTWAPTRAAVVNEFSYSIHRDIDEFEDKLVSAEAGTQNAIFEGLSFATVVFQNECSNYDSCILITFSDMNDWRPVAPKNLQIDLTAVDVVSVMLNCQVIYQPSCTKIQDIWTQNFNLFHVRSVSYLNDENIENNLVNALRR